jgi:hypothetical protein
MEYLGFPTSPTPSGKVKKHIECDEPYHLLAANAPDASIGSTAVMLWKYNVLKAQGSDFLLRLYTESSMRAAGVKGNRMKEQTVGPDCAEPIAQSGIFSVCDMYGRHAKLEKGRWSCVDLSQLEYWVAVESRNRWVLNTVCKPETSSAKLHLEPKKGVDKGLLIGLPVGLVGGLLLVSIIMVLLYKRHVNRKGTIRL